MVGRIDLKIMRISFFLMLAAQKINRRSIEQTNLDCVHFPPQCPQGVIEKLNKKKIKKDNSSPVDSTAGDIERGNFGLKERKVPPKSL